MVAKPEDSRVDRHHEFVSTVSLAGNRFDVGRRDIAWSSGFWRDRSLDSFNGILPPPKDHTHPALPHLPDLAKKAKVLMAHSQSRSPMASTTQMSLTSKASGKPGRGWGVKIREDLLQREDPVPVRLSGRRHGAAPDDKIRIWVRVPKGRLAFFVPPHLPLGPPEEPQELLADDGRATPLRSLLARRNGQLCAEREAAELPGTVPEASATMLSAEQEHVQSAAKLSAISASQMSPCASSTVIIESDRVESNFKSLVEAATGIPIPHQKLFYGPAGVLEDNSKALYQFEIGQGSLLHLSIRRDPRKVADYEERRKQKGQFASFRKAEGMENPHHLLDERLFPRIRAFMNTKVGPKMGKDLVMVVPDWKKAGTSPLEYEWPHEQIWLDYSFMHDNGIFDFAGRIRKKFHRLPRLANAAASAKLVEAHAHTMQRSGLFNDEGLG